MARSWPRAARLAALRSPPGAHFCIECGHDLTASASAQPPAPEPASSSPPEERRQATILFADLSGYTAAAERMDPEAVKVMVGRTLRRLGEEIERFGGTIDKFIGDNVMGVFGAPLAHGDDPERAVRAGLAMQEAMHDHGAGFSLRVGVNTGEVMAGPVGDRYTVMGDPVNVAARLQAAARPGSVTVGEETYRASRDTISYKRLEPLALKGKRSPSPHGRPTRRSPRRVAERCAARRR